MVYVQLPDPPVSACVTCVDFGVYWTLRPEHVPVVVTVTTTSWPRVSLWAPFPPFSATELGFNVSAVTTHGGLELLEDELEDELLVELDELVDKAPSVVPVRA